MSILTNNDDHNDISLLLVKENKYTYLMKKVVRQYTDKKA